MLFVKGDTLYFVKNQGNLFKEKKMISKGIKRNKMPKKDIYNPYGSRLEIEKKAMGIAKEKYPDWEFCSVNILNGRTRAKLVKYSECSCCSNETAYFMMINKIKED